MQRWRVSYFLWPSSSWKLTYGAPDSPDAIVSEPSLSILVNKPWGTYEVIKEGRGFLVKYIVIKPGEAISLQRHRHRAEHWIVVVGDGLVTCGNCTFPVSQGGTAFIPSQAVHRMENVGESNLEFVEIQMGSLLSEDDIERIADNYDRL